MRLVNFSVTNYRSITTAHKINLQDLTVLVGKNNEGKSNLLTALNVEREQYLTPTYKLMLKFQTLDSFLNEQLRVSKRN